MGKRGRGAGSDPERGRELALKAWENGDLDMLKFTDEIDYDLVIVIAGLGGGTGTGSGPVVASYIKKAFPESSVLSVLVLPDADEYGEKTEIVNRGLVDFYKISDSLLLIDNSRIVDRSKPLAQAYDYANEFTKEVVITI
ncbi:cell division GTPase, partial [Thiovulum sp. ES]